MVKLRNETKNRYVMYQSDEEHPDSAVVEPGQVLSVRGEMQENKDSYVVDNGREVRAYPKSAWALVTDAKANKAEKASKDKKADESEPTATAEEE